MSDEDSAAEVMYGQADEKNPAPGTARIKLWYWPFAYHGHAFLKLIKPDGTTDELLGYPASRNPDTRPNGRKKPDRSISDGSRLIARHEDLGSGPSDYEYSRRVATVASGPSGEIAKTWHRGMKAMTAINGDERTFDYKLYDPSFVLGGSGGQIQNSNSVIYTLGCVMDLDLGRPIRNAGVERKLPGWGRDLLDPKYERYVAPPMFPVRDAPSIQP